MAKRLPPTVKDTNAARASRCSVCGGAIVPREEGRGERYPKMLVCRRCHASSAVRARAAETTERLSRNPLPSPWRQPSRRHFRSRDSDAPEISHERLPALLGLFRADREIERYPVEESVVAPANRRGRHRCFLLRCGSGSLALIWNAARRSGHSSSRSGSGYTMGKPVGKGSGPRRRADRSSSASNGAAGSAGAQPRSRRASSSRRSPSGCRSGWTWVSTQIPSIPKPSVTTRLAVFRPTPFRVRSSSRSEGTCPS